MLITDDMKMAQLGKELGAEIPFLRDPAYSREYVDIQQVLQYAVNELETKKIFPDLVVSLEVTFPFRPKGFLDDMLLHLAEHGFDSVIAAKRENRGIWKEKEGKVVQLEEGLTPRQFKEASFLELRGVGFVTHPEFLREGNFYGQRVGIYELDNSCSSIEVRSDSDFQIASSLMKGWF